PGAAGRLRPPARGRGGDPRAARAGRLRVRVPAGAHEPPPRARGRDAVPDDQRRELLCFLFSGKRGGAHGRGCFTDGSASRGLGPAGEAHERSRSVKLARRLSVIEPSPTLAVSAKAAALKAMGLDVISFGAGEPDFDTPAHIKEAAKKALDAGATKYTLIEGTVPLRKGVAAWIGKAHGLTIDPSEVIV